MWSVRGGPLNSVDPRCHSGSEWRSANVVSATVLSKARVQPIKRSMVDRLEHVFLVGVFPVALALAGCDVDGALPPLDGGVGGTASNGIPTGSCGSGGSTGNLDAGLGGSAGGDPGDARAPAVNLWADSSFEAGMDGWTPVGNPVLSRSTEDSRTGAASLHVGNRTQYWEGAGRELLSLVTAGSTYEVAAWVRLASVQESPVQASVTLKRNCAGDSEIGTFIPVATTTVGAEWTLLQGSFEAPTCDPDELLAFLEIGSVASALDAVDYYVDDVSLTAAP